MDITFDSTTRDFCLNYIDHYGERCRRLMFCPFCGGRMPSRKEIMQKVCVIPNKEKQRLTALTQNIKTIDQAIKVLGEPDHDDEFLIYKDLSEYADIYIDQRVDDSGAKKANNKLCIRFEHKRTTLML